MSLVYLLRRLLRKNSRLDKIHNHWKQTHIESQSSLWLIAGHRASDDLSDHNNLIIPLRASYFHHE
jgi:hypothetical protein